MRRYEYFVYILMNRRGTVLYIGVTSRLFERLQEHREGTGSDFTKRYHVHRLVYLERFTEVRDAIRREKQLKAWRREKKEALIRGFNPQLVDLSRHVYSRV